MTDTPAPKPKRPSNNPKGRPSGYSPEIAAEICKRIAGGQSLISFRTDPDMPHPQTFYEWCDAHPEFAAAVEKAREKSAHALIDQAREIADDATHDTLTIETKSGAVFERVNREWTERSKLRVGMRQWLAARFNPQRYGDRQHIEHTVTFELGAKLDMALRYRAAAESTPIDVTPEAPAIEDSDAATTAATIEDKPTDT